MANEQQKGAGTPVVLRDRYNIFPGSPLPDLSTGSSQAFLAEDARGGGNKPLFALLVRPGLPSRPEVMRVLKGIENPGLMTLIEWGPIYWPPLARKVMAVIYERPLGGRVMPSLNGEFKRIEDTEVLRKVVTPVVAALREFNRRNLTHRAVRPTNMFWATPEHDRVVLGDCTTTPPALEQPAILEPIESIMTWPSGRGAGNAEDDLYAFGASLVLLLLGRNPFPNAEEGEILRAKMQQGSYPLLAGDERVPVQVIELLRGLLIDDPKLRWTNEGVDLWLNGRRLPPMQSRPEKRAARGFNFNGKEYFTVRELAIAFTQNWDAAQPHVADGRLELWLRRAVDNKELANAVATAVGASGFASPDKRASGDFMLAKVCLILDPAAPIRYKSLAVMPDAFGTVLAVAMADNGDVRLIAEAITREINKAWTETRDSYSADGAMMDATLRSQRSYLERATIGNGIERALYEMNEGVPCMSPFVADDYVVEIRDLLPALNAAAKKGDGKAWPVDRHIAAFIAARTTFEVDRQMTDLADPSPERSTLGMLNLLALIQWRMAQPNLFGLASWVGGLMQPAINSYHNRQKRREIEREVPRLVRQGNLIELARLLDNPEERYRDQQGFADACAEWRDAAQQIRDIETGNTTRGDEAVRTAQQVAALISVTISLVTFILIAVTRLL